MSASSLKLASAVIGIGGVATGAGVGIYQLVKTQEENKAVNENKKEEKVSELKKISELFGNDVVILKTNEDVQAWKDNWVAFIDAHQNAEPSTDWSIESWSTKKSDKVNVPQDFKTRCTTNSEVRIAEAKGDKFEKVKKYCTKKKSTHA